MTKINGNWRRLEDAPPDDDMELNICVYDKDNDGKGNGCLVSTIAYYCDGVFYESIKCDRETINAEWTRVEYWKPLSKPPVI